MHWLRRIHLYSGLFMFPWVMLYAGSALLFNHPRAFPDRPQRILTPADFDGTPLQLPVDPADDAEQVVAALNARLAKGSAPLSCRVVHPEKAGYTRDVLTIRARGTGQEHAVLFDIAAGSATVNTREQSDGAPAPFATRGLKVPNALGERVKTGMPKALVKQGLAADDANMSIGTDLIFFAECEGTVWRVAYSIQTGAVNGSPVENPHTITTRRFLTQLHMSHGYSGTGGIRWIWALGVDLMFASMVFWGFSGLFMWWQIKAVRLVGVGIILVSMVSAALIAVGMHQTLTSP